MRQAFKLEEQIARLFQRAAMTARKTRSENHRLLFQCEFAAAFLLTILLTGCASSNKAEAENAGSAPPAAVVKVVRRNISSNLEIASEFLPFHSIGSTNTASFRGSESSFFLCVAFITITTRG